MIPNDIYYIYLLWQKLITCLNLLVCHISALFLDAAFSCTGAGAAEWIVAEGLHIIWRMGCTLTW